MLEVDFCGIQFRNPLLLAPGPFSDETRWIVRFVEAGIGGVVLKSAVSDSLSHMRRWPRPRYRLPFGLTRNFVLYSFEQAFRGETEDYLKLIREAKTLGVPIIASLLAAEMKEWVDLGLKIQEAGADGLELDISCPHTSGDTHAAEFRMYVEVTLRLSEVLSIPVIPKLKPNMDNAALAVELERAGAEAVTACNRLTGIDVDLSLMRPVLHGSYAGFGGPWSKFLVFRHVLEVYRATSLQISASGGVTSAEDVLKYIALGASTVQALSVFMLKGMKLVGGILNDLRRLMEEMGIRDLREIRGIASRNFTPPDEVERDQPVKFRIDAERCTGCGRCLTVCRYDAISISGKEAFISAGACDGCGLCAEVCPAGCISAEGVIECDPDRL
ncbi:4Fe-4S binding protein [Candidatus Poribacteria bacterium]|nr:4Fe-4S binding protein [Candidatus Poribacteria bacterium]